MTNKDLGRIIGEMQVDLNNLIAAEEGFLATQTSPAGRHFYCNRLAVLYNLLDKTSEIGNRYQSIMQQEGKP